jgi:addiction module HigA family antidote
VNPLALALRVQANRIGAIVKGQRGITGDTVPRLARYFGTSAQMWIDLQAKYDLAVAEDALSERVRREVLPRTAAGSPGKPRKASIFSLKCGPMPPILRDNRSRGAGDP